MPETVLAWGLAFVVIWFGANEVLKPEDWVGLVPAFFGGGTLATWLVLAHGATLVLCGLAIALDIYRFAAAAVVSFMLAQIVFSFIIQSGLSDVAVRDIGLLGASLSLTLMSFRRHAIHSNS